MMSGLKNRPEDQQLPIVQNEQSFIQDMVINDIRDRKELGISRYGTALQANNGRDMAKDAYEEAMDLTIYLKGLMEEISDLKNVKPSRSKLKWNPAEVSLYVCECSNTAWLTDYEFTSGDIECDECSRNNWFLCYVSRDAIIVRK